MITSIPKSAIDAAATEIHRAWCKSSPCYGATEADRAAAILKLATEGETK